MGEVVLAPLSFVKLKHTAPCFALSIWAMFKCDDVGG